MNIYQLRKLRQSDVVGSGKTSYRITVRQLESMIRLSEALARLYCDTKIRPEYVNEAVQLLHKSIIHVETSDVVLETQLSHRGDDDSDMEGNEEEKKMKLPQKKSESTNLSISYTRYSQITKMLVQYLNENEGGYKQISLIQWYIESIEGDIKSEEELTYEAKLIKRVIERLVNKDYILIVLKESSTRDIDERTLGVNPNYHE